MISEDPLNLTLGTPGRGAECSVPRGRISGTDVRQLLRTSPWVLEKAGLFMGGVSIFSNRAELSIGQRRNEPPNVVFISLRVKPHKKITDPL